MSSAFGALHLNLRRLSSATNCTGVILRIVMLLAVPVKLSGGPRAIFWSDRTADFGLAYEICKRPYSLLVKYSYLI